MRGTSVLLPTSTSSASLLPPPTHRSSCCPGTGRGQRTKGHRLSGHRRRRGRELNIIGDGALDPVKDGAVNLRPEGVIGVAVDVVQQAKLAAHGLEEGGPLAIVGLLHVEDDWDMGLHGDRGVGVENDGGGCGLRGRGGRRVGAHCRGHGGRQVVGGKKRSSGGGGGGGLGKVAKALGLGFLYTMLRERDGARPHTA